MRWFLVALLGFVVLLGTSGDVLAQAGASEQVIQIELAPASAYPKGVAREKMLGSFIADVLRARSVSIALPDASLINRFAREALQVNPSAHLTLLAPSSSVLSASRIETSRFRQIEFQQKLPDLQRDLHRFLPDLNPLFAFESQQDFSALNQRLIQQIEDHHVWSEDLRLRASNEIAKSLGTAWAVGAARLLAGALDPLVSGGGIAFKSYKAGKNLRTTQEVGLGLIVPTMLSKSLPHATFTFKALGNQFNASGITSYRIETHMFDGFSRFSSFSSIATTTTFFRSRGPFANYGFNPMTDSFTRQTSIHRTTTIQTGPQTTFSPSPFSNSSTRIGGR